MSDKPLQLNRLTTEYDREEDRLRLSGLSPSGDTCVCWLTRRMLRLLIHHLCRLLDQESLPVGSARSNHQREQQAAANAIAPHTPVDASAAKINLLVQSVNIKQQGNIFHLTFQPKSATTGSIHVALNVMDLRQWLTIVHSLTVTAAWQVAEWPHWIATPEIKPEPKALH